MRRNDYMSPAMQERAYQQEVLLRRNMLRAARSREARTALNSAEYLEGRRHSYGMQPDFPVYPKFIYPSAYGSPPIGYGADDSMADLFGPEFDGQDSAYYAAAREHNMPVEPQTLNTEKVVRNLTAVGRFLEMLQSWPLPRLSLTTGCICFLLAIFIAPRTCAQSLLFPAFRLSFGTLYPAYASYKAVRTKNVKEYVKWMMYWIVYAFFTCIETFTDIFLSWFPFYYEVKVVIVLWLLSPATKGSSTLYRKFVHPMLTRREQEIDEYLNQAKERGYSAVLQLGSKGVNYATNVIMQTAIKGGGNLVQTIRRSYSLSDLSEPDMHRTQDEVDDIVDMRPQQRILRPRLHTAVGRSASGTRHSTGMYFTEVDVSRKGAGDLNYNIRSSEDISSGYSSAEPALSSGISLSRAASMTNASKTRLRPKRSENPAFKADNTHLEHSLYPSEYLSAERLRAWEAEQLPANEILLQTEPLQMFNTSSNESAEIVENEKCSGNDHLLPAAQFVATAAVAETAATAAMEAPVATANNPSCPEQAAANITTTSATELYTSVEQNQQNQTVVNAECEPDNDEDDVFLDTISTSSDAFFAADNTEPQDKDQVLHDEGTTKTTVSPRELLETLKEIKQNFRMSLDAPVVEQLNDEQNNPARIRRAALHNKGKAPAPPPPPAPPLLQFSAQTAAYAELIRSPSICSMPEASVSAPTSRSRNIFKNIKDTVFRGHNASTQGSLNSLAKETEI